MLIRPKEPHAKDPRKLPSGRWQARVTYYDSETGKRHETSRTFATERDAKRWGREQELAYRDDPTRRPPSDETFGSFFARWLDGVAASRVRDTTVGAYRRYGRPLVKELGNRTLKSLLPSDFQAIYAAMIQDGKASSTVHHTHVVAHSALNEAVSWGLIPFNPTDRVKPPRVTSPEVDPPTSEEARRLLQAADADRLKALWWFITLTGCRRGEALALKWSDIEWDQHVVWIRRTASAEGGLLAVHDTKTAKGRRAVALSDYLLDILVQHRDQQTSEQSFYGPTWNSEGWVFPSDNGTLIWPSNLNTRFRRLRQIAGVRPSVHIHSLRHAMATTWLTAGIPIKVVSERLGHASIAITLQIYGHLLPNMQATAAAQMEALFVGRNDDADE